VGGGKGAREGTRLYFGWGEGGRVVRLGEIRRENRGRGEAGGQPGKRKAEKPRVRLRR
jgi:hypothetical protein